MGSHQQSLLAFIPCHKNVLSKKEKMKAQAWEAHSWRKISKRNSSCLTPSPSQFLWAAWFGEAVSIGDDLFFHVDPPPKGLSALSRTPRKLQPVGFNRDSPLSVWFVFPSSWFDDVTFLLLCLSTLCLGLHEELQLDVFRGASSSHTCWLFWVVGCDTALLSL